MKHDLISDQTISDGTPIRLRVASAEDRDVLVAGFERLSADSRTARFFTGTPHLTVSLLDHLSDVDHARHVAIVAEDRSRASDVDGHSDGLAVGVARYFISTTDATQAEIAVTVIDEYQGRGIGRLLLRAVVDHAAEKGITTVVATVLGDNSGMLHLLESIGAIAEVEDDEPDAVSLTIPIGPATSS